MLALVLQTLVETIVYHRTAAALYSAHLEMDECLQTAHARNWVGGGYGTTSVREASPAQTNKRTKIHTRMNKFTSTHTTALKKVLLCVRVYIAHLGEEAINVRIRQIVELITSNKRIKTVQGHA